MPGKEIKGRSARANYRHGGRTGFKQGGAYGPLRGTTAGGVAKAFRGREGFKESQKLQKKIGAESQLYKPQIKKTPAEKRPAWEKKAEQADTIKLNKQLKTIKKVAAGAAATVAGSAVYGTVKRHKKAKKEHEAYMKSKDKK